jgi:capsular polysaccharide biosynthesis protein
MYVSSLPGSEGRAPIWAVNYVREKLIRSSPQLTSYKKLYFKRGTGVERRILNEDALTTLLQKKGFEIIEPDKLTIAEQVDLMQQAMFVISAHGAALSNLLFSRDGAAVLELFSPDYFRTDCYYTLSCIRKLNYWYLAGAKPPGSDWGDIMVDENLLLDTIQTIENIDKTTV